MKLKPSELRTHIQALLNDNGFPCKVDGDFGPKTFAALHELDLAEDEPKETGFRKVRASSFADPADVASFRRCKNRGGSDMECFKVGDNGIGLWGDDTTGDVPMCALPRDVWMEKWSVMSTAKGKKVVVRANGKEVVCLLGDTMPHTKNIRNGAGIDLNPAAAKALGLKPPFMVQAEWRWV